MEVAYAPTVLWQKLRGNGHITYSIGPMTNMTTNQCLPVNKHDLRDVNSDQTLRHYFISGTSHLVILLKVGSCDVGQSRNRYCIETLYKGAHGLAILHAWVHHGIPTTCAGNTCFRRPPGARFPLNIVVEHWIFESHPKNRCNGAMHLQSSRKLP